MINAQWLFSCYMIAGCLFIVSIRNLASPRTARTGNWLGMGGMLLAVIALLIVLPEQKHLWILIAAALGGIIGVFTALKVRITSLPQMIAAFNGVGGLSSVLVGMAEVLESSAHPLEASLGIVIGAVAFTGSLIAFAKLQGWMSSYFGRFPFHNIFNFALLCVLIWLWADYLMYGSIKSVFFLLAAVSIWGITITLPVGGADMPIMISVLNACSGWAAAAIGFSLENVALIITGAIVGASGAILSFIMTKAMNRSLREIIFSSRKQQNSEGKIGKKPAKAGNPEDAAFILENANKVIIVPGYGMAVAQAQHAVHNMAVILQKKYHVDVKYAIHPVAGRMPGHMNVLLAEANVPYDEVYELEEINREFATADAAYVIGANDITNPAAKSDPSSPLYGMPILEVEKAKTVFFVKRSLNAGYSGVDNPLFYNDNTIMLYGDAKKITEEIVKVLE